MFEILDNKVFMDSVHGYISVPKCFVKHIINTEMYQRLRNVDQTGMRILYPDAKHDRFGHSLGVYYLGCKAVDALLNNFSKDAYWKISSDNRTLLYWAKNKILFMLACLLHDIGHAPFSHALEEQILTNSGTDKDILSFKEELTKLICKKEKESEKIDIRHIKAAPHEQMGAKYIVENLGENLSAIYDELIEVDYPKTGESDFLFAENYDGKIVLSKDDIDADLCFIARMILGLKYTGYEPEKQIRNCFIELLNGNNFDVDKLDYILRDTKMSGIANINVDVERLLGAISIVTKTVYKNAYEFKKSFKDSTIYVLQNLKSQQRIHLSGKYKGSIKLFPNTKVEIKEGSIFEKLGSEETRATIKAINTIAYFSKDTEIYKDREPVKENENLKTIPWNNGEFFQYVIRNASIYKKSFGFEVCEDETIDLTLNGWCDIEITGNFKTKGVLKLSDEGKVEGNFEELVLLGNNLLDCVPDTNAYNEFSVGYKKQAMNVIANVLEARDYLYLWVYAHHKVVYYANYLIPVTAKFVFEKISEYQLPWNLTFEDMEYLDDYYVWSEIKKAYKMRLKGVKKDLCKELFSCKYKNSVYKSLAEYDLVFGNFSDDEKQEIKSYLIDQITEGFPYLNSNGRKNAGYIGKEFLDKLKSYAKNKGMLSISNVKNIVFVEATYKAKPINPYEILIIMGDNAVVMEEIPLLKDRCSLNQRNTTHYFYLYYEVEELQKEMIEIITNEMKILLRMYFGEYIRLDFDENKKDLETYEILEDKRKEVENRMKALTSFLLRDNRFDDLKRATEEDEFCEKLYQEYRIT